MANIQKIEKKGGVSFKIIVTRGRDSNGKQIRHYKTWKPPQDMAPRKAEKEAQRIAFEFEQEIDLGYVVDNRQTFAEYAAYVLETKEQSGVKHTTIQGYEFLLKRINESMIGKMKLTDIRPQHLNMFYRSLQTKAVCEEVVKAKPKPRLKEEMKAKGMSQTRLAIESHTSNPTVTKVCRGEVVTEEKARAIAAALQCGVSDLFTLQRAEKPLSSKTIQEHHRLIHAVLSMAEREMLVPYNAADKAISPKTSQTDPNYFQPEQVASILEALETEPLKWQMLIHLLIVTGCRRGEIAGLKWDKIDMDNAVLEISANVCYAKGKGVYETTTKTGTTRYLKIPDETVTMLKKYRATQSAQRIKCGDRWKDMGYVFTQEFGEPMNPSSITAWTRKFSNRHDLPPINPHAFRHTVASVLIANGTDIVTVSKQLGHAQVSTTSDRYSHLIDRARVEASECIADTLLNRKNA